jgi:hypothetical protein
MICLELTELLLRTHSSSECFRRKGQASSLRCVYRTNQQRAEDFPGSIYACLFLRIRIFTYPIQLKSKFKV